VLAVQSQLRQLVLKLVRPKGMSSEERALLMAAEAVYGISELALSTGDLPTRADNALLMSALGEPNSVAAIYAQDCLHLMAQLRPSTCRCRDTRHLHAISCRCHCRCSRVHITHRRPEGRR
jgi:hypothetical protein